MITIDFKDNKLSLTLSNTLPSRDNLLHKLINSSGFRKSKYCYYGHVECVKPLIDYLIDYKFTYEVTQDFKDYLLSVITECETQNNIALSRIEELEKGHGFKLWDFQVDNVVKMAQARSVLNCDSMGLGKTLQTLCTLPSASASGNTPESEMLGCLVVCPQAATSSWKREIGTRRPDLTVTSLKGSQAFRWPVKNEVLLLSYDSILPLKSEAVKNSMDLDYYTHKCPEGLYLVADELQLTKSFKAVRTKRFRHLANAVLRKNGRVIGLTGTPLVNKPVDFWCILQNLSLSKETFGDWDSYVKAMGGSKNKFGAYVWNEQYRSEEIHDILAKCVIRHTLEEVFPDMPGKVKTIYDVDLESTLLATDLDKVWDDLRHLSTDQVYDLINNPTFDTLSKVRSKIADLKTEAAIALLSSYEEYDDPIIVVSSFKVPIEKIGRRKGWKIITGDVSKADRDKIEEEFRSGKLKGLAMTIRSSGMALNLQNCNRMIFIDRDYAVSSNVQTEGRIHRIGQTKTCFYDYILINHPLEYRINEILEEKQAMVDQILEPIKKAPNRRLTKGDMLRELYELLA